MFVMSLETYEMIPQMHLFFLCRSLLTCWFSIFVGVGWKLVEAGATGQGCRQRWEVGGMAWLSNILLLVFPQLAACYKN